MATLVTLQGPNPGQRFPLERDSLVLGRHPDAGVYLESLAVSRQHARLFRESDVWFVEDLGSSNGTFLNGVRLQGRGKLADEDVLKLGPFVLGFQVERSAVLTDTRSMIRAEVHATPSNQTLYAQNPAFKLQAVLEISRALGETLDLDPLLDRLVDRLLRLFPQADRGMAVLCEGDALIVHAQRTPSGPEHTAKPFSRTVVRRALEQGVGLLSQEVGGEGDGVVSATLVSLHVRSYLCVPLIGRNGRRLGVIQLDCLRPGQMFREEDLDLLTAIALHVSVVLENAALHAERIRQERLHRELLLARDIQQSFLPAGFEALAPLGVELFARVLPAREVSGDLYDFFLLPDGRLAFFVGDVSGKGMPAALFMIAVRTLTRHLAPASETPSELLRKLHAALVADNPTELFVTGICGMYDPSDGSVRLASGGHPPPLVRKADGAVITLPVQPSGLLGFALLDVEPEDAHVALAPGETLALYTDGFTEAFASDGKTMFGEEGLISALGEIPTRLPLSETAEAASAAIDRFTGHGELQDDQTLLLLRRR